MKKFNAASAFGIILMVLLTSCSIQKRHHLPGYYIESHVHLRSNHHVQENSLDQPIEKQLTPASNSEIFESALIQQESTPHIAVSENAPEISAPEVRPVSQPNDQIQITPFEPVKKDQKQGLVLRKKLSPLSKLVTRKFVVNEDETESDKMTRLILAIVFLVVGIWPASVYLSAGKGSALILSIAFMVLFLGCVIAASIIFANTVAAPFAIPTTGILLTLIAFMLGLAGFIHALVVLLKNI